MKLQSEKERYDVLLQELADLLKEKNDTIYFQKIEIDTLKSKLENAEKLMFNKPVKKLEIR